MFQFRVLLTAGLLLATTGTAGRPHKIKAIASNLTIQEPGGKTTIYGRPM
jgi:hypothetical protein